MATLEIAIEDTVLRVNDLRVLKTWDGRKLTAELPQFLSPAEGWLRVLSLGNGLDRSVTDAIRRLASQRGSGAKAGHRGKP